MKSKNVIFVGLLALQAIPALAQTTAKDLISVQGATLRMPTEELLELGFESEEYLGSIYFTKTVRLNSDVTNPPDYVLANFSAGDKVVKPELVYNLSLSASWFEVTSANIEACTNTASALSNVIWQNSSGTANEVPRERPLAGQTVDNIESHFEWLGFAIDGRVKVEVSCLERDLDDRRILDASISVVDIKLEDRYIRERMALKSTKPAGLEGTGLEGIVD